MEVILVQTKELFYLLEAFFLAVQTTFLLSQDLAYLRMWKRNCLIVLVQ